MAQAVSSMMRGMSNPFTSDPHAAAQTDAAQSACVPAAGALPVPALPGLDSERIATLSRLCNPIWIFDIDTSRVHWANEAALGVWRSPSLAELTTRDLGKDMSESVARRLRQYQLDFASSDARFSELWTLYPRGIPRTMRVMFSGIRLDDGRVAMLCEALGEQQADPETLRSAEALLHTPVMITLYDQRGVALYRNPAARHDVASASSMLQQHFADASEGAGFVNALRSDGSALQLCRVNSAAGERWHRISARRCRDAVSGHEAWLFSEIDVSDLKRVEAHANYLAMHDSLTGLPNRHFIERTFRERIDELRPTGKQATLIFIDLDNFKKINDSLGHTAGDQLLLVMAGRLREAVGGNDLVARLGGDEFMVFASSDDAATTAHVLCQRLLKIIAQPLKLGHHEVTVTASMGVALYPRDSNDLGALMRQADLAMYSAKDAGGGTLAFYCESMLAKAQSRLTLEIELQRALDRREFVLHYQPRHDVITGRVVGVEALVRWNHPQRGLVAPVEFIPACEETGLIVPLGEQVLMQAVDCLARWQRSGIVATVAVNLSPRQFSNSALIASLRRAIDTSGCDPTGLELEITESVLLGNDAATLKLVHDLRALGCGVTVDDFGTGYSNLAYLQRIPLTCLKVDRSFVAQAAPTRPLAEVIIALGHMLGLRVVAEGVETEEQLQWLRTTSCDEFQGFLRAPALTAAELERYITGHAPA